MKFINFSHEEEYEENDEEDDNTNENNYIERNEQINGKTIEF